MFSKFRTASSAGSAAAASISGTFSVISADVVITGNVTATADLHVDGSVEGDIECSSLVQGESSRIKGSVAADSARLSGRVDGSVAARELVITRTAHVTGDISYETISIEAGGHAEGRFALKGGTLLTSESDSQLKLVATTPAE